MKTKKDIQELNFNDLAFFTGMSTTDAKWEIADKLGIEETTLKGFPKVRVTDTVNKKNIDFKMRSNSKLDGVSSFDYLCDHYNKGTTMAQLNKFSENNTFIKKLKFTGKFQILNEIMNPEQLMKLQKTWLLLHLDKLRCHFDAVSYNFIQKNKWAQEYIVKLRPDVDFEERAQKYLESLRKKEAA